MNTIDRERPVRLTFAGEVESYDWQSAQWIRDLSRDPREFIPLSYPPAADAYLYLQKATCANAIAHQLKDAVSRQVGALSDPVVEGDWFSIAFNGFYTIFSRSGVNRYSDPEPFYANVVWLIGKEWLSGDLTDTDFTSTIWEKVVCHMWCHMSDDCTFTYENWLALIQAIFDDSTLGDAQQWLKLMVILLGRKGLTNLGFLKVNDNDVLDPATDCTCV